MYIYREVVFTKVVQNHLDSQFESHMTWLQDLNIWKELLEFVSQDSVWITFGFLFCLFDNVCSISITNFIDSVLDVLCFHVDCCLPTESEIPRQNRPLYFIKGLPFRYTYLIKFYFYEFQYYIKLKLYSLSCDKIFDTQHAWVLFVSLVVAGEWRATAGGRLVLTVVG